MEPTKALKNLKKKLKNDRFYPTDYDRESLNTLISFYNSTEKSMKLTFTNYRKLVLLLYLYELRNAKIDKVKKMTAKDAKDKIEQLIIYKPEDLLINDLIDTAGDRKLFNYQADNDVTDESKAVDYGKASSGLDEFQQKKLIELIDTITTNVITSESNRNKKNK
mgnify:CR=1 FL=1